MGNRHNQPPLGFRSQSHVQEMRMCLLGLLIATLVSGLWILVFIFWNIRSQSPHGSPVFDDTRGDFDDALWTADPDEIAAAEPNDFPVHYVRLYDQSHRDLCHLECLSLVSVMKFLAPSHIYIHTDHPNHWPFKNCTDVVKNWSTVKFISYRRHLIMHGQPIGFVEHEADIAKLQALFSYGGIAIDFDVYLLPQITKFYDILNNGSYDCVVSQETIDRFNMGFFGCWKESSYVASVLEHYRTNYQTEDWFYNSGYAPKILYDAGKVLQERVFVDDRVITDNSPKNHDMWNKMGVTDWRSKMAYHSFYHDCNLNPIAMNTSLGEMLRCIRNASWPETRPAT